MPAKGKQKGNTGERLIADFLTNLFGHKFMRVPNSGAALGGKNAHRKQHLDATQISYFKSDLIPPSHMQKLVIESKFYASFPFDKLAGNERIKQLDKWVEQILLTVEDEDVWFLVVRINRKGTWACFHKSWAAHFQLHNHVCHFDWIWCEFETLFKHNKDVIIKLSDSTSA